MPVMFVGPLRHKSFSPNEAWVTTQSERRFCFVSARPSGLIADLYTEAVGMGRAIASWTLKHAAEGSARRLSVDKRKKLFHQSFSVTHRIFITPLSPHEAFVLHRPHFTAALCAKGWLEGYNLEKTWDPITDTNTLSQHAALSPPLSHILVSAAGLCLPGTRQLTCLSHSREITHSF